MTIVAADLVGPTPIHCSIKKVLSKPGCIVHCPGCCHCIILLNWILASLRGAHQYVSQDLFLCKDAVAASRPLARGMERKNRTSRWHWKDCPVLEAPGKALLEDRIWKACKLIVLTAFPRDPGQCPEAEGVSQGTEDSWCDSPHPPARTFLPDL